MDALIDNDEACVVRSAKNGDPSAFMLLIEYYAPRTLPAAYAILDDLHDAEDAIQDASITAFRKIKDLKDDNAFKPWFLRIVVNRCKDFRRRRPRAVSLDRVSHEDVTYDLSNLDDSIDLAKALDSLPETHRKTLILYMSGLTSTEIAVSLGKSPVTVRRSLSQSYRQLRKILEPDSIA